MPATAFTPDQRSTYDRDGLVAVRGAVDSAAALRMADALWDALERRDGVLRKDPKTWPSGLVSGLGGLARSGVFQQMASPVLTGVVEGLLGPDWVRPEHWGVPTKNWHFDMPVSARAPDVARVFLILSPLKPRGGGTIVVTGSHRVMLKLAAGRTIRSGDAVKELRSRHPWFAGLSDSSPSGRVERFMEHGGVADGVPVRVVEMTGEPGDIYFMHPSLMHAFSTNAGDQARMMLTQWVEGRPGAAYGLS
jgi:hypothetical protein